MSDESDAIGFELAAEGHVEQATKGDLKRKVAELEASLETKDAEIERLVTSNEAWAQMFRMMFRNFDYAGRLKVS